MKSLAIYVSCLLFLGANQSVTVKGTASGKGTIKNSVNTLPYKASSTTCASNWTGSAYTNTNCVLSSVVSGSTHLVLYFSAELGGTTCSSAPTNSGTATLSSWTRIVVDDFTGTLEHYYTCIYWATITGSGSLTVTPNPSASNLAGTLMEVWNITATGALTATSGHSSGPPNPMSVSATSAGWMVCGTKGGNSNGNSEGNAVLDSGPVTGSPSHPSWAYSPYALNLTSGTVNCTITGPFTDSAVMAWFPKA